MRLLLLEDEPNIARPVSKALEAQGHQVHHASNLRGAREYIADSTPDLMLLDVRLPESDDGGFIFARDVRAAGYTGPILFMTARDALDDRISGLDEGGDDYMVKPFELLELLARTRALLRRVSDVKTSRVLRGPLELNLATRLVHWEGDLVQLSNREYALLERFVLTPERVFSPEFLVDTIWGEGVSSLGVVKVYIHHLRSKLGPDVIKTVSGGYRLGISTA